MLAQEEHLSGRHCDLGFAASIQRPTRVHPLARARPGGLAGYSPELPRPREAHQFLQLYGTKDTTKSLQTPPFYRDERTHRAADSLLLAEKTS
jgi:hypothetical protein